MVRNPQWGVRTRLRGGFTIVELLVSLAVISLLIALLLPAVQSSRETARRLQCLNHLKQIALATHNFSASRGTFPVYDPNVGGPDPLGRFHYNICPLVEILPYIDLGHTYNKIERPDMSCAYGGFSAPGSIPQNVVFLTQTIPLYQCPSDRQLPGSNSYRANLGSGPQGNSWLATSAVVCSDVRNGNGAYDAYQALGPHHFTDGLSNTVMYSERVIGDGDSLTYSPWRDYADADDGLPYCTSEEIRQTCETTASAVTSAASFAGHTWLYASKAHTAYDHILPPNSKIPDCAYVDIPDGDYSAISARSQHPGIINVARGDGSVTSISENIDLDGWHAIASRAGMETDVYSW